jgi:hypothetical protein
VKPEVCREKKVGGRLYVLRRVSCGKSRCTKCPHGPYWYLKIVTRNKTIWKYHGLQEPGCGRVDMVDIANSVESGSTVVDRWQRVCPNCRGMIGGDQYQLWCGYCEWTGKPDEALLVKLGEPSET